MKFKKSNILLISLISIFLLLSMSAVSAADIADNAGSDLAADIDGVWDIDNDDVNHANGLSQADNNIISDDPELYGDEGDGEINDDDPIPIETTIESNDENYTLGDDIVLNVTVKDNESNVIGDIGADDLWVSYKNEADEDFTDIGFTLNNESQIVISSSTNTFPVGNYTIKIGFNGITRDGIAYGESNTTIDLKIKEPIPMDTSIESNNETYTFGDNIILNVTVKDNESNAIDFEKSDLWVSYKNGTDENFTNITFTLNNESQIVISFATNKTFPVANYTINIGFKGATRDGFAYGESETNITLNITPSDTRINASDVKVQIGDDVIIPLVMYVESNKTLNYNETRLEVYLVHDDIEEKINYTKVSGGIKLIDFSQEFGNYIIKIKYTGNQNCNPSNTTVSVAILENNTIIFGDVSVDFQTKNITIPIVIDNNGNAIEFSGENFTLELVYYNGTDYETVYIDDFDFISEDGNYTISFANDTIQFKDVKLTVIYANGTLNETSNIIKIVDKNTIIADGTINVNNHTHNVTIPISVNHTTIISYDGKNSTNVTVLNLTQDNIVLVLAYNNGTDNLTITDFELNGDNGNYTISFLITDEQLNSTKLTIIYGNGTLNETNKTVTLKGIVEAYIVPINVSADYQDGEFKFQVFDAYDNGTQTMILSNVTITVSGVIFVTKTGDSSYNFGSKDFTTDENGFIVIKNNNTFYHNNILENFLSSGNYNLTFRGHEPYVLNSTIEITINKVQAEIVASPIVEEYEEGKKLNYIFQVINSNTGEAIKSALVQFRIYSSNIDATRSGRTNSTGFYTSPDLNLVAGTYNLQLESIDSNLICSAVKQTITLNQRAAVISASNRTVLYGSGDYVVATVKDKKTGKLLPNVYVLIQVYTSSKKATNYLTMTDSKGVARLNTGLSVGKTKVVISVLDNNYKSGSLTRYVTVKKTTGKFSAPKVSTYYKSGKIFKIKLTNTKNKALMNGAKVNIKVFITKNKYYNLTGTSSKGLVQFKITFKPGTYKVVVSSADKGYTAKSITSQIKVSKSPIKMAPTSLKVKKGKYFKVKVTSTKSKKVLSGIKVKVKVYTGKKYKTYTIKTNKKGIASLKISQKVGKHKVVLTPAQTKYYTGKTVTKTLKVTK